MYPMRFLDVTLDTYQDTSGYMYLGLFITIHQDTPRYKNTIHVSWTRHDDTSGYNQDRKHAGYVRDTWRLHARYMQDTCRIHARYMRVTCICSGSRIHSGYTDTLKINQRYMRDTCIWKGNQDTFGIHPRYMMRYMYLKFIQTDMYLIWRRHAGYMQDTCGIHLGYMYPQGC